MNYYFDARYDIMIPVQEQYSYCLYEYKGELKLDSEHISPLRFNNLNDLVNHLQEHKEAYCKLLEEGYSYTICRLKYFSKVDK